MTEREPLLNLVRVSKQYSGSSGGDSVTVLTGVDLTLQQGEAIAIIGPSGSGKSTLLQIIGTLDQPTSGEVWIEGVETGSLNEVQTATLRNEKVGFIFQAHYLLPQCTVLENVLVPTLPRRNAAPSQAEERARRLLDRVGLSSRLAHRPGELSGGERQRVAVVRALINAPRLLLADEPTGALDRASAENLAGLLVELNQEEGVALIVVTHALDLARRMKRVLELRDGKLEPLKTSGR